MLLEGIYSGRQKTMLFRVIFFQIVLHPHQIEKGKHNFLILEEFLFEYVISF